MATTKTVKKKKTSGGSSGGLSGLSGMGGLGLLGLFANALSGGNSGETTAKKKVKIELSELTNAASALEQDFFSL